MIIQSTCYILFSYTINFFIPFQKKIIYSFFSLFPSLPLRLSATIDKVQQPNPRNQPSNHKINLAQPKKSTTKSKQTKIKPALQKSTQNHWTHPQTPNGKPMNHCHCTWLQEEREGERRKFLMRERVDREERELIKDWLLILAFGTFDTGVSITRNKLSSYFAISYDST